MHGTIELVREGLTKQTDTVKESLNLEVDARTKELTAVRDSIGQEVKMLNSALGTIRASLDREVEMEAEERNKMLQAIIDACTRVEERAGQKLINESRSIRSLIKASVAAEASDRMAEVNGAKQLAEHRLQHEKGILIEADARDKELVMMKASEWVDNEKADRISVDKQIQNEMDVRTAAAAAKDESRNVLRMIGDQIQDTDMLNRHREVVWDVRKLRKFAIQVKADLVVLKEESANEDKLLNGRVDKEIENRVAGDDQLDEKYTERCNGIQASLDSEIQSRTEDVKRIDGRVDNLWKEKDMVEENLGKTIEATTSTVKKEVEFRLKEDAEIREEELCREASEASLRYIIDKAVGKMEQEEKVRTNVSRSDELTRRVTIHRSTSLILAFVTSLLLTPPPFLTL